MRGLLLKDIKLLKNQKQFFGVAVFMGIIFLATYDNPSFVIVYITMMFAMFGLTTISYDEFDNGMAFLFSLPFQRRDYVIEKYVFGMLAMTFGWGIIVIASVAAFKLRGIPILAGEIGTVALCAIMLSILFLALAFPIEIKFGVEKGRVGFLVVLGIFFLCFYVVMKMAVDKDVGFLAGLAEKLTNLDTVIIAAGACVTAIAVTAISLMVSIHIMERKEY